MAHLDHTIELRTAFDESAILADTPLFLRWELLRYSYRDTLMRLDVVQQMEKIMPGAITILLPYFKTGEDNPTISLKHA
jgi:hypothetical protein